MQVAEARGYLQQLLRMRCLLRQPVWQLWELQQLAVQWAVQQTLAWPTGCSALLPGLHSVNASSNLTTL